MDYDDDEFQRQNHQLAREGCSKVFPVLHPYALPKFEFDDTLHGHLNFNSSVENEIFLSQEVNQWIEEYTHGSNGIEFSSSGVELRRNNVWSEATSSESVEMLLKSVGQEEKVVAKSLIEHLDHNIFDETVSLTKAVDPNLNLDYQISGGELDSSIMSEEHNSSVLEEKVDHTFEDMILMEPSKDYPSSSEKEGASVEEFKIIGLSKNASSSTTEESGQINEINTDILPDSDTMIAESCRYSMEKSLSSVTDVEYVDNPSAETRNLYPSAETSKPFSENLSAKSSNPSSENLAAETRNNPVSPKPSAENSIPVHENLSTETSYPFQENPSDENSSPFSGNPSTETSTSFSEKPSSENSNPVIDNPSANTSIPFSEPSPTETSIAFSENLSTGTSIPFSENPPTGTSIAFSENPSAETCIPFSEKSPAETSITLGESSSQILKLKDPDSLKSNAGSLSNISPVNISIEENKTVTEKDAQNIISDTCMVSARNLPETGCESSGPMQVDCTVSSSELGAVHLDQDDSLNEKEDARSPLESNDMGINVIQAVDSPKNAVSSLLLEGSKENNNVIAASIESDVSVRVIQVSNQRSSPDTTTTENDEQPKSPIFGVSLVHKGSKENTVVGCSAEGNSQNEFSQVGSVVASVSKDASALLEKSSPDPAEKAVHETDAHCLTPVESCNADQSIQEHGSKDGSQDCVKKLETSPFETLEKTGNNSRTGCLQERKEPMIEGNATPKVKNFSFEVNKKSDPGQDGKGSQLYSTVQVSNSKITEGPSKDTSSNQMDLRKSHEVSVSPQSPSGLTSQIGVKGKSERRPRRKSAGKENSRKETALARESVRGEILPVVLTPAAAGQVNRFEEVKVHENVANSGVLPSPKIPDLNNSASIFQQPFTDNQQVQLRAQILVYGSLISGSPPEEAHMIAAFGQSDGGRTWDGVWRAYLQRFHAQQSQPKSGTPTQSRPDMKDAGSSSDQVVKNASIQNKVPSTPIGGQNKGTPPFLSPMIPLSSPLWNTTAPSGNLQSGGVAKPAHLDYHQTLSPLRPPYQIPPAAIPNFNSWLSQGPFSGQWLAASPLPTFNPAPRFPSSPITESVKLTPVKVSDSSVAKPTSNPMVLNSAPIIFSEASPVSGMKRSVVPSDQPSSDPKSRKKRKCAPIVSSPCSTSVSVTVPGFMTSKSSPAKFLSTVVSPNNHTKSGDQKVDRLVIPNEISTKVEESKLQAKEATEHADNAMVHCNGVWSQMQRRCNYDLNSNDEAKLVSSAVSIAAAASVAKAAAAAAKIAFDVAEQARLMVTSLDKSQKHAENLDAIRKAAELAAEAVSQAGKIVAMSEPLSLKDLVEAGPQGYWKTPQLASKQQAFVAKNVKVIEKRNSETTPDKGTLTMNSGGDLAEDQTVEVDGTSIPFTSHVKDKRKPWARKGPQVFKTIGALAESENESLNTSIVGQINPKSPSRNLEESDIKEGCLVEVYKDDDKHNGAWFGANVLRLKDGKVLVSYTEIQSEEGSGRLTEWLPLEVEGSEVPKIRIAHPVTTMQGTRKRRRTAATDFMWSSGDRVDVWIQDRWCEGVVMETNKNDTTSLTVQFPAQGEISVVRSWFVRPSLTWKDGKWVMCHTSEKHLASPGNMPQEKRLKLGSPIVESKRNAESSVNMDLVDPRKQKESRPLSLSTHESVFNVGSTRDNKIKTQRTMRSGLQKEGPGVIFGVPKPGKKQKFMDVSKHYVADGPNITAHDSIKFTKYLIPHPPGSRGWKNNSRSDAKEKQATETKPLMLKSRKPPIPSFRGLSSKSTINKSSLDAVSDSENQSGQNIQMEHGSSSSIDDKSEHLNKRKFAPPIDGKAAKVEKSIPEHVETRRSNRRIQPTSRLLEGLQSSMTISKLPALSHSTHRSHNKVTPKGNRNRSKMDDSIQE